MVSGFRNIYRVKAPKSRMALPYSLNFLSVTLEGSLEEIPFHCDRIFGNIFRRDKLQIIWFVGVSDIETRISAPVNLHGMQVFGIDATHNSHAAGRTGFQSDEIAGFEDSSHCNPRHKSTLF